MFCRHQKMQSNADKYPSELCRGSSAKYTSYNRGYALFPCAASKFDLCLLLCVIRLLGWLKYSNLSLCLPCQIALHTSCSQQCSADQGSLTCFRQSHEMMQFQLKDSICTTHRQDLRLSDHNSILQLSSRMSMTCMSHSERALCSGNTVGVAVLITPHT